MPIADTDLVAYGAANYPEDESSSVGGAIDTDTKIVFTDIAATDSVEAVSSDNGDEMNVTVRGRNAAGEIVTETKALTGTTPITFSTMGAIERFLSAQIASDPSGTVIIRRATGDTEIARFEPGGPKKVRRLFIEAFSDPDNAKEYHEKFFFKNEHGSLTGTHAEIVEPSSYSPDDNETMEFAVEDAVDDNGTASNRLTEPSGITGDGFDNSDKAVPGDALAAGEAIGVWVKMTLPAGNAPVKSTYTLRAKVRST